MSEENKAEEKRVAAEKAKAAAKAAAAAKAKVKTKAQESETVEGSTLEDESEPNFEPDVYKESTPENNPENNTNQHNERAKVSDNTDDVDAKAKAAAAAKAKAGASAKAKAAAKAKTAAAAKAKAGAATSEGENASDDADEKAKAKAKAIAIAKAKAAAAAKAKTAKTEGAEEKEAEPEIPSINQPYLDKYLKVIKDNIGEDVIEESYINKLAKDVPTLLIKNERWFEVAQFLKHNEKLAFDYLSSLHGTDFETHMEVYIHFYSFKEKQSLAIRVKADRDEPRVASVTPIWSGANWPERESYDLLGIHFEGHPNMTRILLSDDWVGYPLRKDYEQHDEEV